MINNNTNSFDDFQTSNTEKISQKKFFKSKSDVFLPSESINTSFLDIDQFKLNEVANLSQEITEFDVPPNVNVFDVAAYILKKMGPLSTMKLQKLVYYSQAWSLVWDEAPLFNDKIEAWANGPVIRNLFYFHRGKFKISSIPIGNPDLLNNSQKETIDAVLNFYGDKPAQWLIDLSHQEKPWQEARKDLSTNTPSNKVINLDAIAEYYSSL